MFNIAVHGRLYEYCELRWTEVHVPLMISSVVKCRYIVIFTSTSWYNNSRTFLDFLLRAPGVYLAIRVGNAGIFLSYIFRASNQSCWNPGLLRLIYFAPPIELSFSYDSSMIADPLANLTIQGKCDKNVLYLIFSEYNSSLSYKCIKGVNYQYSQKDPIFYY